MPPTSNDGTILGREGWGWDMALSKIVGTGFAGALIGSSLMIGAASAQSVKDDFAAPAGGTKAWVLFSGFDAVSDASYAFQGLVVALNRDIGRDGFVLRVYGSHVDYEYNTSGVPGGKVDGDGWQGDAMIGYKVSRGNIWAAAYIGVDYQNYDLTPRDPSATVEGTEWGFKVAADVATLRGVDATSPLYFSLSGNYSTAFDSYWARARVGVNRGHVTFGPEGIAMGNEGFDAQRVGAFLTFDLNIAPTMPIEVTLSGGYQFVNDDNNNGGNNGGGSGGSEGAYGGITFVTVF